MQTRSLARFPAFLCKLRLPTSFIQARRVELGSAEAGGLLVLEPRPLLDRVSSRSEFSDLVWEMQGELGTSHAYEIGGDYRQPPDYALGILGACRKRSEIRC